MLSSLEAGADMPRYFFNLTDGYVENDTEGVELRDLADAQHHAIVFAGEMLRDDPERVRGGKDFHVEVTGARGELKLTVRIECVLAKKVVLPEA